MTIQPSNDQKNIIDELDALTLSVDDDILIETIEAHERASDRFWNSPVENGGIDLEKRQNKIVDYWMGKQFDLQDLHDSQRPHMENILWEAWVRNRSIIMSRTPDISISGGAREGSDDTAEKLSEVIDNEIKKEENSSVVGMAALQRPLYFFGVVKAVWDKKTNDYRFINVHPQNIRLDHKSTDPNKQQVLIEDVETTLEDILIRFPKKEHEIFSYFSTLYKWKDNRKTKTKLATPLVIQEVWFEEYLPVNDDLTGERKWEVVVGVVWRFRDLVLGKSKHPYWDWEGEKKYYKSENDIKKELTEREIYDLLFGDADSTGVTVKSTYRNYLDYPSFPYYFVTLNRGGKHCVDVTTNYEQVLFFQDSINRTGMQINEMNARTVGKDVYSVDAFKRESDIEEIDPRDFDQVVKVSGEDINKVFRHYDYPAAPSQLYTSKRDDRSIGFEMLALNATTRGTRESGDETLGARQMMREQDFGVLDYEVSRTITPATQWMAKWMLQFIKLFYKSPHYRKVLGEEGEKVKVAITQDWVEDGMEVEITASTVDKMQRRRQAQIDAQGGMIDILTYYQDTEQSDPKERALRLMMQKMQPALYVQKYLTDQQTADVVQSLAQPTVPQDQAQPTEQMMPTQPPIQ